MSLLPFLIIATGGAVAAFLLRSDDRASSLVGGMALVAAFVSALAIAPGQTLLVGGSGLATTEYLRLFLVIGSVLGMLLALVGAATSRHRDAPAVTLGVLATSGLALAIPDAIPAILAAGTGGVLGALLALDAVAPRVGATAGIRSLRATIIATTMAIAAAAWIGRDLSELAAQPVVFGLAYLAVAMAVALRFGAIPFHGWAARFAASTPETTLPIVAAMAPAAFAIIALAWTDMSIAPLLVELDSVGTVVLGVAVASIVLGALAAVIQDDIEHVVGYSIIGDAGVVLLALAALDPAAWAPARTWIVAFVVTRAAFAGWAAVMRATFATSRLDEFRGWAFHAPALAIVLAGIAFASLGLPGLAAFDARSSLVALALGGPLGTIVLIATFAPLLYYGRLAVLGVGRAADRARTGRPRLDLRPRVEPIDVAGLSAWASRTWSANRPIAGLFGATLLAVVAMAAAVGAFGIDAAAAGLPPTLEGATESFVPESPIEPELPIEPEAPVEPEVPVESGASPSP